MRLGNKQYYEPVAISNANLARAADVFARGPRVLRMGVEIARPRGPTDTRAEAQKAALEV
jgi:hypothetical protein